MSYAFSAADAFDALVYPQQHPGTVQFLQNQVSSLTHTLTDAGRAFMQRSRDVFEQYNSSAALKFARDVMQAVKGAFSVPCIKPLWEMEELQNADLLMQRWIMANPSVRTLYHAQRCDGYSDTYMDMAPGLKAEDHYDYRRVMDGVFVYDDNGDWKSTQYLDQLVEGDRDLLFEEKVDILNTWNATDILIAMSGQDPTSPSGGSL
ncbi:MAG: hypothetical protein PHQ58_04275 [Rhodoferax sp.]|uniref:hypothetical protein n=1 Tax=Rhodoferax sp. TaxID=50421 RepID=UPI00262B7CA2|nr:hypothetical protein [Rhodoferax sp.]MDD2879631.1 hypothetical protein [Rhodoferax sp.]